jgi:hypothetical protein
VDQSSSSVINKMTFRPHYSCKLAKASHRQTHADRATGNMASKLTFITTTGSHLDDNSVKVMRGHVTRENFIQRRRRRALKSGRLAATGTDRPGLIAVGKDNDKSLSGSDVIRGSRPHTTPLFTLTIPAIQLPQALAYCTKTKTSFFLYSIANL